MSFTQLYGEQYCRSPIQIYLPGLEFCLSMFLGLLVASLVLFEVCDHILPSEVDYYDYPDDDAYY